MSSASIEIKLDRIWHKIKF